MFPQGHPATYRIMDLGEAMSRVLPELHTPMPTSVGEDVILFHNLAHRDAAHARHRLIAQGGVTRQRINNLIETAAAMMEAGRLFAIHGEQEAFVSKLPSYIDERGPVLA